MSPLSPAHEQHPQQVHSSVSCGGPPQACTTGERIGMSAHEIVAVAGRRAGSVNQVHQVLAGLRKEAVACLDANDVHTVASERCGFHQEDAETQYEDDDNGDEVQKSASHPRLGAMSVHKGHRIFDHRDVRQVWGYIMWVNRKLRRECPGNPSKLGMEVLKRMANRQTPRPGQEWAFSVDVAPPTGWLWREFERVPSAMPDPAWRCGWVGPE